MYKRFIFLIFALLGTNLYAKTYTKILFTSLQNDEKKIEQCIENNQVYFDFCIINIENQKNIVFELNIGTNENKKNIVIESFSFSINGKEEKIKVNKKLKYTNKDKYEFTIENKKTAFYSFYKRIIVNSIFLRKHINNEAVPINVNCQLKFADGTISELTKSYVGEIKVEEKTNPLKYIIFRGM